MNKQELNFLKEKYGITPRKAQGQNFLLDSTIIQKMIEVAELSQDDIVLEIGPGFGILTTALSERVQKVITVEQDRDLVKAMQDLCTQYPNIEVHNEDIRTFNRAQVGLQDKQYSLVANLPYSISSWVFREVLEKEPRPKQMIVMVQKEVAARLTAQPGQMSVLSVSAQLFSDVSLVCSVPATSFSPQPKVESSVVKLTLRDTLVTKDPHSFLSLVKSGFSAKRKKLSNNLKSRFQVDQETLQEWFNQANISENSRPQELTLEQWEALRSTIDSRESL